MELSLERIGREPRQRPPRKHTRPIDGNSARVQGTYRANQRELLRLPTSLTEVNLTIVSARPKYFPNRRTKDGVGTNLQKCGQTVVDRCSQGSIQKNGLSRILPGIVSIEDRIICPSTEHSRVKGNPWRLWLYASQ